MQKSCRYFLVCVIAAGLFACVREPHEASSGSSPQRASRLSVDEARAFFEKNLPSDVTRASDAVPTGPFVVENVLPDWEGAEQSSNKRIACVDVPAQTGSEFLIKRRRADETFYGVRAYGKLLVVKSMQTDSLSTYMRYLVPDEIYATFYDGDLSNLFANCEDRGDYCGLELYTTLDGAVVAAARYYEGTLLASVFICDTRMSEFERSWRLRNLLAGVYINRRIVGPTRMTDDWDFGGKTCFYDSRGTLYYVDYIDGVGYATVDVDGTRGPCIDGIEDVNHLGGGFPGGGNNDAGNSGNAGGTGEAGDTGGGSGGTGGTINGNTATSGNSGSDIPVGGDDEQNIGGTDLLPGLVNPLPDQEPLLDLRCPVCGKHPCICIKEVDCENLAPLAGDNSVATSSLYNEVTGLAQFSEFLNAVAGSSVEHGTTGYRDADGALQLMMPYTDGQTNSVQVAWNPDASNVVFIHNHPRGTACSSTDVVKLIEFREKYDSSLRSVYVVTAINIYVLYVYDETRAHNFYNSGAFLGFMRLYQDAEKCLLDQGYDYYNARLYAIAYLLEKHNTGIAILSQSGTDSYFHQHKTVAGKEITSLPVQVITYKCK
ncbi:hypothetical protein [Alistipes onderdonkii]|uniref:hypothetical protein n=1 Tax=Alistipes onderdonkii TaxID=328813 RepID=UPI001876C689|nr:hypothetical protein [Alistipes onderdonkii]MBE5047220.1 hypothetical protein [Alistipes onderdonkii]